MQDLKIWNNFQVQFYSLVFPSPSPRASDIDVNGKPLYGVLLEVDDVVTAELDYGGNSKLVWTPQSFAFVETKEEARIVSEQGYLVTSEQEAQIVTCLEELFRVERRKAKAFPISVPQNPNEVGFAFSTHALNATYLGPKFRKETSNAIPGMLEGFLVASDKKGDLIDDSEQPKLFEPPIGPLLSGSRCVSKNCYNFGQSWATNCLVEKMLSLDFTFCVAEASTTGTWRGYANWQSPCHLFRFCSKAMH